jgi:alpha-beta hydrolase superfamily lysophospholipase
VNQPQAAAADPAAVVTTEGEFEGVGGVRIQRRAWLPGSHRPRAVFVLAHGMSEHSARYDRFGRFLAARGVAVHALDHRGHGLSGGETGTVEQFGHFLDDLSTFLSLTRREESHGPQVLFGHSMGGLIATACVLERNPQPDLLILSGPAIVPILEAGERRVDATRLSRDPEEQRAYLEDPLILRERVREELFLKLFEGITLLVGRSGEITQPVLLVHGLDDRLCSAEGAAAFVRASSSSDVTVKLYPGGRHEMLNEINRDEVMDDIWQWLDARIPR